MASLHLLKSDSGMALPWSVFPIVKDVTIIGRGRGREPGLDIQLPAFYVGRREAKITRDRSTYVLEHLANRINATWVFAKQSASPKKLALFPGKQHVLNDGDIILIGDYRFVFCLWADDATGYIDDFISEVRSRWEKYCESTPRMPDEIGSGQP